MFRRGHALYGHRSTAQFDGRIEREGIGGNDPKAALCDSFHRLRRPWTRFPAVVLAAVLEPNLAATALVALSIGHATRISSTHLNRLLIRHGNATQELETRCLVRFRVFEVGLLEDRLVFGPTAQARQCWEPIGTAGSAKTTYLVRFRLPFGWRSTSAGGDIDSMLDCGDGWAWVCGVCWEVGGGSS